MQKIGIILDCEPNWGGSFQYAQCLFEAVYSFSQTKETELLAFYIQPGWLDYLSGFNVKCIKIAGEYIRDTITIDSEKCMFVVGTAQTGWSERLVTPVIEPIHDLMHRYEPGFPEVSENDTYERREQLFLSIVRNAVGVLVDSNEGARHVKDSYGDCYKDKIYVLPFAAPHYLFDDGESVELPFDKYFFYPAQFWTHKNHINLIYAVAKLRDQGILVKVVFVGSKKNGYDVVATLIDKLKLNEQISILGYVSDAKMRFLYENACALFMPTFFGPTNIPPIEAITLGCPVAVSNIYGMPEQLGNAALYFDPSDVDGIASAMNNLWEDESLRKRLIKEGNLISNRFSLETFNKNFETIGNAVLERIEIERALFSEILSFCENHSRLYIYGAGEYAFRIKHILDKKHIFIDQIVVTSAANNQKTNSFFNKSIADVSNTQFGENDGVIVAMSSKYIEEVIAVLKERQVKSDDIFVTNESWLRNAYFNIFMMS